MICPRCGEHFNVSETRSWFNYYYSGSAEWNYDNDLSERLCKDCAEDDVNSRWMDGTLKAADGDPPPESQKKWWNLKK
ncbi:hypothetical protein [Psychrobacillus lasiicapitis]|uniref:Uncharacterized protein n=1 Tax=Psychrobacillus lasiicapitis TaxID=1636719 RepID=A0A544T1U3_9BACI|nr:hypothetical protein [Psychrobacillus lasiicapitis]TQR11424.1 hypothetical protein FG382_15885 [Psychrobacillus lasiicapitis]GGA40658.1 hypothetical protein GCM10011384_32880 [Psychrobacillus lasiicapitis]